MNTRFSWFYYAGRWLMRFCLLLLTNCTVRGRENVPASGPILIVANHMNYADPPLVAVSIPRKLIFMAKEELFQPKFTGYFIRGFGAFPVHRGQIDRTAMHQAKEILDAGYGLVMFPEGMRSRTGQLIPAFPGSALIAAQNNVPILPVGIIGTEKMGGFLWIFKRPRIVVIIGQPFTLSHNGRVTKEQLAGMTNSIMYRIAKLLPSEYHGYYAKKV